MNKPFDVSLEQLAHDLTMLKMQEEIRQAKFNFAEATYEDLYKSYLDEYDIMKKCIQASVDSSLPTPLE